MSDYCTGLLVGGLIGYCLSLGTLILMVSLCVVAKRADRRADNGNV